MTTTYKLLQQYFLERDDSQTTTGNGYYYGSGGGEGITTDNDPFNNRFNSVEVDNTFSNLSISDTNEFFIEEIENDKIFIYSRAVSSSAVKFAILNEDGSLDNSFVSPTIESQTYTAKQMTSGDIIIGGSFTTVGGVTRNGLAKLSQTGSVYPDFNPNVNGTVLDLQIDKDNNIIVGGTFGTIGGTARLRIAKINSITGSLDSNFNPSANNEVNKIAIQPDGKILIGGNFTTVGGVSRNSIARLNSDGTLDQNFIPTSSSDTISRIDQIVVRSDGKILVGGAFTSFGGLQKNMIVLINSDGSIDNSFSYFNENAGGFNFINTMSIQEDNKVVISGRFTLAENPYIGSNHFRLNADGSLDTSFYVKSSNISSISTVLRNNKILIGAYTDLSNPIIVDEVSYSSNIVRLKEKINTAPYKLVYTVPLNTSVILGSIISTNHNEFPAYYDIAIVPHSDTTISEKHYFIWDSLLLDNDFQIFKDKLTLSAGDKIYVYSSTDENMSFNIFGTEITA